MIDIQTSDVQQLNLFPSWFWPRWATDSWAKKSPRIWSTVGWHCGTVAGFPQTSWIISKPKQDKGKLPPETKDNQGLIKKEPWDGWMLAIHENWVMRLTVCYKINGESYN